MTKTTTLIICHQDSVVRNKYYDIRNLVIGIKNISDYPFVGKAPRLSLVLGAINEAFPRALFVVSSRDPVYNAQSLYIARQERKRQLDNNRWWGVKPKEYSKICNYDSIKQSVYQVYYILKQLDEDRELFNNRMLWIRYEDICEKPGLLLDLIYSFMKEHGLNVSRKDNIIIPTISCSNTNKIEADIFKRIRREADSIFNGWRPKTVNEFNLTK